MAAATARSQRGKSTTDAPRNSTMFMHACMPVTWNSGTTPSITVLGVPNPQSAWATAVCITERCVWMQPLGLPVVPDV
jgi:hypothetical protein